MGAPSWSTVIAAGIVQLLIAVFVAFLTVFLALRRFRRERWWEKKYEAYEGLLLALHSMKRSWSDDLFVVQQGKNISDDQKAKSTERYEVGSDEVMKYADLSEFLLSAETEKVLSDFGRETDIDGKRDYADFLSVSLEATDRALKRLIVAARNDLSGKAHPGRGIDNEGVL